MNEKGFAITGFIYTIFVIFIGVMFAVLSLFNSRKNILDNLKKGVLKNVNELNSNINDYEPYTSSGVISEFTAKTKGYYKFVLHSPKIGNTNGSTVQFEVFLSKGENLYILVGSSTYNSGMTEIRTEKDNASSVLARASYKTNQNYVASEFKERIITDVVINNNNVVSSGKVTPTYQSKTNKNENLNRVQYIKDCINGNSSNNENNWTEIKIIVDGDNKAQNKKVISEVPATDSKPYSNITDNNKNTYATSSKTGEQCIIIDLERTYNIDMISILHRPNVTYYGSKTYVSSDNQNYHLIRMLEEKEDNNGLIISAYEDEQVIQVGNIYVPVKTFQDAKWLRVYHHNNLKGTIYWDSLAQSLTNGGYDALHKQSILYSLDSYKNKNNQFEFLLEYSDVTGYNRWIQTSNPITNTENVTGYKAVNISWNSDGWYGLAKSNSGSTLLDGSKGNNLFYEIGAIRSQNGGVQINSTLTSKEITDLWIRIDNLK